MPIQYDIADGILSARISGEFTPQEFAGYLQATSGDPRFHAAMSRLIEIADDARFPPTIDIVKGAAQAGDRSRGTAARFAYVARTPLAKGIASMFMGHAGLSDNYQIFENVADARAWLAG